MELHWPGVQAATVVAVPWLTKTFTSTKKKASHEASQSGNPFVVLNDEEEAYLTPTETKRKLETNRYCLLTKR
jgi:hypothetical protein